MDKIIEYYINVLDINDIANKKLKALLYLWVSLAIATFVLLELSSAKYFKNIRMNFALFTLFIISIITYILILKLKNKILVDLSAKNLSLKKDKVNFKNDIIKVGVRASMLVKLKDLDYYSEQKIQFLITLLNKRVNNKNQNKFVIPSIFITILVTVWTQYIIKDFSANKNLDDYFNQAVMYSVIVGFIIAIYFFIKKIIVDEISELFNRRNAKIYKIINILEDILLENFLK